MKRMRAGLAVAIAMSLVTAGAWAQGANTARLSDTVKKLDAASSKFQSAQADVKKENYEKVVRDTTTSTGIIYFLRNGNSTQMGAKMNPPEERTVEYKNGVVRLFTPGT